MNERDIFHAAVEIADPAERTDYLEKVCAGDPSLKRHVEGMLQLYPRLGTFLESPAVELDGAASAPQSAGRFQLGPELARGGMGVIYSARDESLGRDVAVKVLHERYSVESLVGRRFLDEARITAQLQHPGIPPVFEVGTLGDGRPYLAMKLIKGRTLEALLKERAEPANDRGRLLAVFEQICQAVGYAHSRHILHRDLKPANVMVGAFGEVQVMDWGLAKLLQPGGQAADAPAGTASTETTSGTVIRTSRDSDSATLAGSMLGTPAFMAPEQAGGEVERLDERTDVFGLGAILCVILTGRPPYTAKSGAEVQLLAIRGKLADAHTRLEQCGADAKLVELCRACLSAEREGRPRDAGAVAATVAGYLAGVEERARQAERERAAAEARAAEQRKRRRVQLALAATVLVLFGLVGFGLWWREREAVESQKREAQERVKAEEAEEEGRKLLYTTDMRLAPFVWRDDRTTAEQLRILLAKHIPDERMKDEGGRMKKPDLRGFEWYYYQHLLEHSAAVFSGHDVSVADGAFTSNGQLVTLDQNGQVRRWDLGSQKEDEASRHDLTGGPSASVRVLSPNGRRAALAEGNKVHVFDTSTGKETFQIDSANNQWRRLIFSRDGDRLIIVDDKIRWVSAVSGEVIASLDEKFGRVNSLALSADGLTLAVVGHGPWRGRFSIFRLDLTAKTVILLAKEPPDTSGTKVASALSPDGRRLAVSLFRGMMVIFDTATGRRIAANGSAHPAIILAMAFSGDGAKLATADAEGTIKIWADAEKLTSESTALVTLKGHQRSITTVGFSTDGKRLVTTSVDKTARVWDLKNPNVAIRPLERFQGPLDLVARFSADGQLIAGPADPGAGQGARGVHLWDAATGRLVRELSADNETGVYSVAFSPTDHRLLAVGHGGPPSVSLWDIDAGTELARLPAADLLLPDIQHSQVIGTLTFSPDGKYLVAGFCAKHYTSRKSEPFPLAVWEVATRRLIHVLNGHTGFCTALDFSRDGTLLASGSRDGTAIIWSTETWKATRTLENRDRGIDEFDDDEPDQQVGPIYVEDVAFSPDGETLALASYSGSVHLWDVASGNPLKTLKGHSSAVRALVFSPDGRTLASGSADQTVRLWNVPTRRELMQLDPGSVKLGPVKALAFSPDGRQLLAVGTNAVVWSTAPIVWKDADRAAAKPRPPLK